MGVYEFFDSRDCSGPINLFRRGRGGGDLNGRIGKDNNSFEQVHKGYGYGTKNDKGKVILEFSLAYDLMVVNIFFKKRYPYLVTYKSGGNHSQIDFIIKRRWDIDRYKDYKIIPRKAMITQYRLVGLDVKLKSRVRNEMTCKQPHIRRWVLKGANQLAFQEKVWEKGSWDLEGEADILWKKISGALKKLQWKY